MQNACGTRTVANFGLRHGGCTILLYQEHDPSGCIPRPAFPPTSTSLSLSSKAGGRSRRLLVFARRVSPMLPLYRDEGFTFRFAEVRVIPRFRLEDVPPGRRVFV